MWARQGRTGHRWWIKGQRPPGLANKRFASASIFAAVRPATGEDFALVLPRVSPAAVSRFLADFAASLREDTHAVLVLDQAGWHGAKGLQVPESITLVPLPPYSPDLNPVERVWLDLREGFVTLSVFTCQGRRHGPQRVTRFQWLSGLTRPRPVPQNVLYLPNVTSPWERLFEVDPDFGTSGLIGEAAAPSC